MTRNFDTQVTGGLFIAAAFAWWGGWALSPYQLGTFFKPEDFSAIFPHVRLWLWLYRVQIFGMVILVLALAALSSLVAGHRSRVLVWPASTVISVGSVVGAMGAAFYFHFGVGGAFDLHGKDPAEVGRYVDGLRVLTEYITCVTRFSRVFPGVGYLLLAWAIWKWRLFPSWLGAGAAAIGVSAMAVTMGFPDNLEYFIPVFHLNAVWMLAAGVVLLRSGINTVK